MADMTELLPPRGQLEARPAFEGAAPGAFAVADDTGG